MPFEFATALSFEPDSLQAARGAGEEVRKKLGGRRPDFAALFATPEHTPSLAEVLAAVREGSQAAALVGCAAQGIINDGREIEGGPALCLMAASLPGVNIECVRIDATETPEGPVFSGLPENLDATASLLLIGDPYGFPAAEFLAHLENAAPDLQVIGGMASGILNPGTPGLFLEGEVVSGAVGVVFSGPIRVRPLVSQGCRPFGRHMVITRAEKNTIYELGGKPAIEQLSQQFAALSEEDRRLLKRGLHLGRAVDARKSSFGRGDFLIRNVVGVDPARGGIALGDFMRPGTTVQFHLRDEQSASEDLRLLLGAAREEGSRARGAMLFSCNGRGSYLFSRPNHDAGSIQAELGQIPLVGFFAAGEVGPIGGRNFLHGFTASLALFEEI